MQILYIAVTLFHGAWWLGSYVMHGMWGYGTYLSTVMKWTLSSWWILTISTRMLFDTCILSVIENKLRILSGLSSLEGGNIFTHTFPAITPTIDTLMFPIMLILNGICFITCRILPLKKC